ncbi:hypothetical protein, partial [Gluconobacter sphaericus]
TNGITQNKLAPRGFSNPPGHPCSGHERELSQDLPPCVLKIFAQDYQRDSIEKASIFAVIVWTRQNCKTLVRFFLPRTVTEDMLLP